MNCLNGPMRQALRFAVVLVGSSGKGGLGPYYVQQFLREQSQTVIGD